MKAFNVLLIFCYIYRIRGSKNVSAVGNLTTSTSSILQTFNASTTSLSSTTTEEGQTSLERPNSTTTVLISSSTTKPPMILPSDAQAGNWKVTSKSDGVVCILVNMATCLHLKPSGEKICIPSDATVGPASECGNSTDVLELIFGNGIYSFSMEFEKRGGTAFVDGGHLRIGKDILRFNDTKIFKASTSKSYKCDSETTVKLNDNVTMVTKDAQIEAFRILKTTSFKEPHVCKADHKLDYTLPIICSIVLSGLVALILIVYFVARIRISRRPYSDIETKDTSLN